MRKVIITFLLLLITSGLSAENEPFQPLSIGISPGMQIPLGEGADLFSLGGGGEIAFDYRFQKLPFLRLGGMVGYSLLPLNFNTSMSAISIGASAGTIIDSLPGLILSFDVHGGAYYAFLNNNVGPKNFNPYILPSIGVHFRLSPSFSIGVQGNYRNYLGLYQGIDASLGIRFYFGGKKQAISAPESVKPRPLSEAGEAERLQILDPVFQEIFPVFFKYYDDNPIGKGVLKNNTDQKIVIDNVSFYIKQYMDSPKTCRAPSELQPGEEAEIELNALFTEKVLEITESTKATAELTLYYSIDGEDYQEIYVETVRLYDRNATTWDDDRKVAAFVTAKDPAVLTLAKNVAGMSAEKGKGVVNPNLRIAIAIHNTLRLYGMNYVIDPKTPYKELSTTAGVVDFLQFPRQSLQYKAGDCDDLSILTNALLESVGVETAFITVPGHIFIAFSLDITPVEAKSLFLRVEDLIFHEDLTWVPLEITQVQGSFLEAWATGAKEWREAVARDSAAFLPTHEAWTLYEPVGLPGQGAAVAVPDSKTISEAYFNELTRFVEREIYPQTAEIESEMTRQGESAKLLNELGILYAKYGLLEKATTELERAVSLDGQYMPALVNLGNLTYMAGELKKALEYYNRASQVKPDTPSVLLGIARVNHDLENYGLVDESFEKLKEASPALARRFAYLDLRGSEAERAAEIGNVKEEMIWQE
ncbi:MAG: hypothetical protein JW760_14380 [Spirochaetales bacterium]|nr:hypothetical protein [Spirochaetales bacterium]